VSAGGWCVALSRVANQCLFGNVPCGVVVLAPATRLD
jgi:hypothetical protein